MWDLSAVEKSLPDRPVWWIDDEHDDSSTRWAKTRAVRGVPTTAVACGPNIGMTSDDVEAAYRFGERHKLATAGVADAGSPHCAVDRKPMPTNPHPLSRARAAAACAGAAAILLLTGCGQSSAPAADVDSTTSTSAITSTATPTSTTEATSSSTTVTETENVVAEVPPAVTYAPEPPSYVAPTPAGVTCGDGSIAPDYSQCYDNYPYLGARQAPPPPGMFPAEMTPLNAADAGVTLGPYCGPVALANGCVEPGGQ